MTGLSDSEQLAIEHECQKLALTFAALNDTQQYDALVDLFTEDASFARPTDPDNPTIGRDAILTALKARPTDRITRHICTNIIIDVVSAEHATGRMYATLYTGNSANKATHGLKADHKQFIGEFADDYVKTAQGWRIKKRTGNITFTAEQ